MTDTNNGNLTQDEKEMLMVIVHMALHSRSCESCSKAFLAILKHGNVPVPKFIQAINDLPNTSEEM